MSVTLHRNDATADAGRPLYCQAKESEAAVVSSTDEAAGASTATKMGWPEADGEMEGVALADADIEGGSSDVEAEGVGEGEEDAAGEALGVGAADRAPATLGVGEMDAEMLSVGEALGVCEEERETEGVGVRVDVADWLSEVVAEVLALAPREMLAVAD